MPVSLWRQNSVSPIDGCLLRKAALSVKWHFDIEIWEKAVVVTARSSIRSELTA
jgi:hypothetical protein